MVGPAGREVDDAECGVPHPHEEGDVEVLPPPRLGRNEEVGEDDHAVQAVDEDAGIPEG